MTHALVILSVAALSVAFGLLSRRRELEGRTSSSCSSADGDDACDSCSLDCDRPETTHVRL